jgi:hypothetical protein
MEPATELVVHAALRHGLKRVPGYLPVALVTGVEPAFQQIAHRGGVRELGRRAESPMARIVDPRHGLGGSVEQPGRRRRGDPCDTGVCKRAAQRQRVAFDPLAIAVVDPVDLLEDRAKPGAAVFPVGREVGPAVEDLPPRRQERGEGPASLPRDRLHRTLVARIHVGALVPVHLDADEVPVEEVGQGRILVRFAIHDMAPMAPHGPDIEQDRAVLPPGGLEGLLAPGVPVDRLVGR